MKARELTLSESEKEISLKNYGVNYELIFLTDTGLKKSILDATLPLVKLLKDENAHNYDLQLQGSQHKVMLPCIIFSGGERIETKVSLYRPETKSGDPRFWPGRLSSYAHPNQVFAIFVVNSVIVLLNLSDEHSLDLPDGSSLSEVLENIDLGLGNFFDSEKYEQETDVEDAESSEIDEPSRFEVSSYGWDSDVEGLVKRMNRGDIKLPGFQRGFVWSQIEQSRFIESLILGLPVPNIFLAKDGDSKTLNIIDGQQRLKTLQRYLAGEFPISNSKKIHEDLRGCYFNSEVAKTVKSKVLEDADARVLSDSILHSIVIRPDPSSDSEEYGYEYNKAVIQIFRRLNTSGKPLQPQEVRSCIFYGPFDDLIHELNENSSWRNLFGAEHSRYKDVETILRFFALYENFDVYKAPMPSFLDCYMEKNRNLKENELLEMREIFESTVNALLDACGPSLFKTGGTFLLSKYDAVSVGFAKATASGITLEKSEIIARVQRLLSDEAYLSSTAEFINDTGNVIGRINAAIKIFQG
jgi:hypothetical protein